MLEKPMQMEVEATNSSKHTCQPAETSPLKTNKQSVAWQQKWGNVAQIAAALASIVTCCAAVYGLTSLSPVFQNISLKETNSRLEHENKKLADDIGRQMETIKVQSVKFSQLQTLIQEQRSIALSFTCDTTIADARHKIVLISFQINNMDPTQQNNTVISLNLDSSSIRDNIAVLGLHTGIDFMAEISLKNHTTLLTPDLLLTIDKFHSDFIAAHKAHPVVPGSSTSRAGG
jgi:hypothetical protein